MSGSDDNGRHWGIEWTRASQERLLAIVGWLVRVLRCCTRYHPKSVMTEDKESDCEWQRICVWLFFVGSWLERRWISIPVLILSMKCESHICHLLTFGQKSEVKRREWLSRLWAQPLCTLAQFVQLVNMVLVVRSGPDDHVAEMKNTSNYTSDTNVIHVLLWFLRFQMQYW